MNRYYLFDFFFSWAVILPIALLLIFAAAFVNGRSWYEGAGRHEARIAEAQAREAEARAAEARGIAWGTAHQAWAGNAPLILLLAGGVVIAGLHFYWSGRNEHAKINGLLALEKKRLELTAQQLRTDMDSQPATNITVNVLSTQQRLALEEYARTHDKKIHARGDKFWLLDNKTGDAQRVYPKRVHPKRLTG